MIGRRTLLITGAASGIGRASALRMAGPGTALVLHTRADEARLEATAQACRDKGAETVCALGDVGDAGLAARLIDLAGARVGRPDAMVAVAGAPRRGTATQADPEAMIAAYSEAVLHFAGLVRSGLDLLKRGEKPCAIGVSSFVAHGWRTDLTPFAATAVARSGLETLIKALALELAPQGVRVNGVAPGLIEKDEGKASKLSREALDHYARIIPMGRRGAADEVAGAIEFLASSAASYVTGQILHVNGGLV